MAATDLLYEQGTPSYGNSKHAKMMKKQVLFIKPANRFFQMQQTIVSFGAETIIENKMVV